MQKGKRTALLFTIGSVGYGLIEWLWRGRTHWSMLIAGGLCFTFFAKISDHFVGHSQIKKACAAAGIVTTVEFLFGMLFNRILHKNIWDYSDRRANLLGQICPLYSFFWAILGLLFVPLAGRINRTLVK